MNSMTGFGRSEIKSEIGRLTVEISSINSRFLEISVRMCRPLSALEPQVREQIAGHVARGKLNVFVNFEESEGLTARYRIDESAVQAYSQQLRRIQKKLNLPGEVTINDLLLLPEIARPDREQLDPDIAGPLLAKVIDRALKGLLAMRSREGKALAADMRKRCKTMNSLVRMIEKRTSNAVKVYAGKLAARIDTLLSSSVRDSVRLEEEIAIFADRTDVAEECTRLRSHISQYTATLVQLDAVGRRLNFIIQEMNREANTIGSKNSDFDISTQVISLKEEIEKLREQVQNIE